MKKTILTLAILASISFSSATFAQDYKCNVMKMSKDLKVSGEQKESIKTLNADFEQEKKAIKMTRITEEMQKVKIEALSKEHKAKVMALLTPEQLTKFNDKMQSKDKKKGKSKHAKMDKKKLGEGDYSKLDDTSKTKIKELNDAHKKQIEAVKYSRIAPEMQETKIKILKENLAKEINKVVNAVTK